ncbi:DNA replication complex GINS family protein [Candidatus Parvarchaeota archaeon]|nr:DNA replication complex GINS family protein [Candidatus Parvarchaeota archaeon]
MVELTYSELRRLQQEEKATAAIVALEHDFYDKVGLMLLQKKEMLAKSHSIMEIREYENTRKIVKDIYSMRQQKILFKALRSNSHQDAAGMTVEEHELFDRIVGILDEGKKRFEAEVDEETTIVSEEGAAGGHSGFKKIRFLKEVPAFRGLDNNIYGPYKPGDETAVPESESSGLVKGKYAQVL